MRCNPDPGPPPRSFRLPHRRLSRAVLSGRLATQTFQDVQADNIRSVVPFDYYAVDYMMLDALARHFAGAPEQTANPPLWIVTPDNMPATAQAKPTSRILSSTLIPPECRNRH